MSKLRGIFVLTVFAMFTLPLMPLQWLFSLKSKTLHRNFPHWYHNILARILGLRIIIQGQRPQEPSLLVCNHVSWLDIVALSAALPVSFVAKREVKSWPFFGQLARLQNSVFVDRERRTATASSRDELSVRLAAGDHILLFPEGTSSDGNGVLPFKSSFFAPGEKGLAPVIPVTLAYQYHCGLPMTRRRRPHFAWYGDMDLPGHLWRAVQLGPITLTIRFHEALQPASRKQLASQAENRIARSLSELLHQADKIS